MSNISESTISLLLSSWLRNGILLISVGLFLREGHKWDNNVPFYLLLSGVILCIYALYQYNMETEGQNRYDSRTLTNWVVIIVVILIIFSLRNILIRYLKGTHKF
jgi:hypothetical protein